MRYISIANFFCVLILIVNILDFPIYCKEEKIRIYYICYIYFLLLLSFGKAEMKNNRIRRRVYELLSKAAASASSQPRPGQCELHFVFYRKPDSFLESHERNGHVSGVHFEKTVLKGSFFFCICLCYIIFHLFS